MGVFARFVNLISDSYDDLLEKAEDPAKLIDQYLYNANSELAEVKRETAGIMAEERRARLLVEENEKDVAKYKELARRAILAGNEDEAKILLTKKQEIETIGASLKLDYDIASENAAKMRQLHDKLNKDINTLNAKRQMIKAKTVIATARSRVEDINSSGKGEKAMSVADHMLDEIDAMDMLSRGSNDKLQELEQKYMVDGISDSVNDELAAMKAQLGMN